MIRFDADGKAYFDVNDFYSVDIHRQLVKERGLDTDIVEKIKRGIFPRYLFKYRTIEECANILKTSSLHFSKSSELRDPFEGKAVIKCSDISILRKRLEYKKQHLSYDSMPESLKYMMAEMMKGMPDEYIIRMNETAVNHLAQNTGILCLTGKPDDICMWAYYADSHKGVCLKLDLLAQPDLFCPISHVAYDKKYHQVDLANNPDEAFYTELMLKKSDMWKYEDEFRVLATHFSGDMPITNKGVINEIIFGYYTPDDDIKNVRKLAAENGFTGMTYSKIALNPQNYLLEINKI